MVKFNALLRSHSMHVFLPESDVRRRLAAWVSSSDVYLANRLLRANSFAAGCGV